MMRARAGNRANPGGNIAIAARVPHRVNAESARAASR
jgi:hypothetical protein